MMTKRLSILLASISLLAAGTAIGQEISDGKSSLSIAEVRAALLSAPPGARESMTRDQLSRFIDNLLIDKRLAAAAEAEKVNEDPEVKARMEKAARDVLVRSYVEAVAAKMAAELPNLDALARERYEVEKGTLKSKDAVNTAHILFRIPAGDEAAAAEAKAKAEKTLAELKAGADFATLAKERSEDGSAAGGGELGWRDRGGLVGPYEKAAYALKPGEISGLVRSQYGYHIIKLLEHRPAQTLSFEQAKEQLLAKIRNELMGKRRDEWIKPFRGTKSVEVDDALLETLRRK